MSNKTDIWMPLYVADYLSSTTRLTTEQHGAYLLLIIDYWKNGRLPDDDSILSNITRLTSDAWARHRGVLQGFFEVSNGEWVHSRIEKEIEKSGDLKLAQIKKSILGNYVKYGKIDPRVETDPVLKEWWKVASLNVSPKESAKESTKDPSSPSPTHLSKDKKNKATVVAMPEGLSQNVWDEFISHRKSKGAKVTQIVVDSIAKEAQKAGWQLEDALKEVIVRNWQSFKADWVKDKDLSKTGQTNQSVMSGLTRGLVGGGQNVRLLGN